MVSSKHLELHLLAHSARLVAQMLMFLDYEAKGRGSLGSEHSSGDWAWDIELRRILTEEGVWGKRREDSDLSLGLREASEGWNSLTWGKVDPVSSLTTSVGERPIQCVNAKQGGWTSLSLTALMSTERSRNSAVDRLTAAYTFCPWPHWERFPYPPGPVPNVFRDDPSLFVTSVHNWLSHCLLAESSRELFIIWHHSLYNFSFLSPLNAVWMSDWFSRSYAQKCVVNHTPA